MRSTIKTITRLIRSTAWWFYYAYDYIRCAPSFKRTNENDQQVVNIINDELGELLTNTDKIIIYATYLKNFKDPYLTQALEKLPQDAIVIFINNGPIVSDKLIKLSERHFWVNRTNVGRDICAYSVGLTAIDSVKENENWDITLINDSVFLLENEAYDFFHGDLSVDVLSHTVSEHPRPHQRSYMLRFNNTVRKDLSKYLATVPRVQSRYSAIHFGELGMSLKVFRRYNQGTFVSKFASNNFTPLRLTISDAQSFLKMGIAETDQHIIEKFITESETWAFYSALANDVYELQHAPINFKPFILKRELYEKGLVTKATLLKVISASTLSERAKQHVVDSCTVSKRLGTFSERIKKSIGEI